MKREELIPRYDRGDTNSSSFRSIVGRDEMQGNGFLHFISDSIRADPIMEETGWSQEFPVRAIQPAAVCVGHKEKKVLVVGEERPREIFGPLNNTSCAKGLLGLQSDCRPNPTLLRLKSPATSHQV